MKETTAKRPLPRINGDNRPFWEGCGRHELTFQACTECGHVRWPPAMLCPACHHRETRWIVSRGVGRIHTFAVYHTAFHPAFSGEVPYVVAVVALEEGPRLLTNIVGCPPEEVVCDMPVRVTWETVSPEITLPKFTPV